LSNHEENEAPANGPVRKRAANFFSRRGRVKASTTSAAVSGTGLLVIAQGLPEGLWKQLFVLAAPWLSLPVAWLSGHYWTKAKWKLSDGQNEKSVRRIQGLAQEIIDDPSETPQRKEWAQKELQAAHAALFLIEVRRLRGAAAEEGIDYPNRE
jgi:hypothetical protein